jgi:hypothetical protein
MHLIKILWHNLKYKLQKYLHLSLRSWDFIRICYWNNFTIVISMEATYCDHFGADNRKKILKCTEYIYYIYYNIKNDRTWLMNPKTKW